MVFRGPSIDIVPGVVQRYTRINWETSTGMINHDVYMIVTPKVRQEARDYFRCPDLEGAEIESQGSTATRGSHWEKRVFENEAMTGVATQVYAITRLTLALFEDSGWYKANYECSATRLAKVRCTLVEGTADVPDEYDYNAPNFYKDKKGRVVTGRGRVELADFCPYYMDVLLDLG
ncbi:hypothetical protein KIN20_020301 [Parelaphostrongylus tenuis]|uniref:Leishmanolysin-like peptidase n=1 Tax=Parelaphostrongylus tenuis TaxID=148309 RepID=A0AAD5MR23_PARTN|nr:hypothetical protein KIN20_020301 [Parelaphostrongylus tenuis]